MADTRHHPILNYLRRVLGTEVVGGVTDAELLHRFVSDRDEAAFELLLWRHAGMVLHVCRQVLRESQAVEDAFQATFLVFVRKAASVSRRESLGGWLYRVAYRIALKARAQAKKHVCTNAELHRIEAPEEADDGEQRELRRLICEEVNRLPPKYRAPVIACYFEAKTHEEAAQQLGWPRGTVAGRLARAREMLHRRLVRRGVTLTASALAAALSVRTAQAALSGLIETTIQTAKLFAAGRSATALVSPRIAALAEGVLIAMYWTRVKIVMAVLLIVGLGGASAALWPTQQSTAEEPGESASSAGAAPATGGAKRLKPAEIDKLAGAKEQSEENLKRLALAMVSYAEAHQGRMPAPAIYGKDGKALLSWRVAILPYLDQNNLYKQFHLNEPWDSPHNRKLMEENVPKVYAPVGKTDIPRWRTYYQVFVSSPADGQGGGAGMMGGAGPGGGPMGAGSGGGSTLPGGSGSPTGGGSGGPPAVGGSMMMKGGAGGTRTQREKRMLRWSMVFDTRSGRDYVSQLHGLGVILAVPVREDGTTPDYKVIRDLTARPAQLLDEDIGKIQRIYWVDDKAQSVNDVMNILGVRLPVRPSHFVAFMPEELEQKLFKLEKDWLAKKNAGHNEDDIQETRFRIKRTGGRYEPEITSQTIKMRGGADGMGASMMAVSNPAAFVKGQGVRFPAHFTDGTSNTILIVEAGNAVPWTKPEDLRYADDEPLPELGGLFPDVFHAAFADGYVRTLTKKFDEKVLRTAITANAGEITEVEKIEAGKARSSSEAGDLRQQLRDEGERLKELLRINEKLLQETERNREQVNHLLEAKQKLLEEMLQDTKRSRGTSTRKPVQKKYP